MNDKLFNCFETITLVGNAHLVSSYFEMKYIHWTFIDVAYL